MLVCMQQASKLPPRAANTEALIPAVIVAAETVQPCDSPASSWICHGYGQEALEDALRDKPQVHLQDAVGEYSDLLARLVPPVLHVL